MNSPEHGGTTWKEITPADEWYLTCIMGYTECLNRRRYADNDKNRHEINPNGWGRGWVSRNFNTADTFEVI
jgi:hypothetical protein